MPMVLLCLLLVRALTLQGLPEILMKFYETTDWQRMTDYLVNCCGFIFFNFYEEKRSFCYLSKIKNTEDILLPNYSNECG